MLVVGLVIGGCGKPAPAPTPAPAPAPTPAPAPEPIVLKAISAWPLSAEETNLGFLRFVDAVNERAQGELVIEILGGPEVVAESDQFEAVRDGVVDMVHTTPTYYKGEIPEAAT